MRHTLGRRTWAIPAASEGNASAAKRVGTPEEIASAAAYLLGPDAGFVTGSDLLIDGGVIAALRAGRWKLTMGT